MNNQNALCVNSDKLDEIAARIAAVRATLDIIHDAVTENPASDALYGLMFGVDSIVTDITALTREGKKVSA